MSSNATSLSAYEILNYRRRIVQEHLVELVIRRRQDIRTAKSLAETWAECVIEQAAVLAQSTQSSQEVAKGAFLQCAGTENAMRVQLASLSDSPAAIVEERKRKALPIVLRFIEAMRGGRKPSKPEIIV